MKKSILILAILLTVSAQAQTDAQYKADQKDNAVRVWSGAALSAGTSIIVLKATKKPLLAGVVGLITSCIAAKCENVSRNGSVSNFKSGYIAYGGLIGTMCFGIGCSVNKVNIDKNKYQFK